MARALTQTAAIPCRLQAGWICLLAVLLLAVGVGVAGAQDPIGASIAENLAAGRSATDFPSRMRIETAYLSLPGGVRLAPTRISGTYAPHPSVALRLRLPLAYVDAGGLGRAFGTGDLSARVLVRAWNHPRLAAFLGVEFFFPTASDPLLGAKKYSLAPTVGAFIPLLDDLFFIPVYQQLISYAGNAERADLNVLRIRPLLLAQWATRWWTLLDPGFLWDLEDDRPTEDTMTIGLEVGRHLGNAYALSGKPSIQVYGSEDFAWAFQLSFTLRFD